MVILVALGLTSCTVKDKHYYQSNPKELQKALKACPDTKPEGLTCEELGDIGRQMNTLAYELQSSPQNFGSKILALQQTISSQKIELKKNQSNAELKTTIEKNEKELADLLAVVKWLESPES